MRRSERGGILSFLMFAIVVVVAGAAALWWFVLRSEAAPPPEIEDSAVVAGGTVDGTWTVAPGARSYVQYRVKEQLAAASIETDATGRTSDVDATMTVDGATISSARVNANLATLRSGKERRDNAIRTGGLQTDEFPDATFALTQPITLAQAPQKGKNVKTDATGELTLHGITKRVTIPLVGRWDGQTIQVVGDVPIRFAEYGITPPDIGGFVTVAGTGRMELQLFFTKG